MPATRREEPLYQRGPQGRQLRLYPGRPNFQVIWYDDQRKRERSCSTGTTDEEEAKAFLDNLYVKRFGGVPRCPTCGQAIRQDRERVAVLIANYLETKGETDAVHPRLAHIIHFQTDTDRLEDTCDQVDEEWAQEFRDWLAEQPDRARAPSTIENSLIQLAAAMRFGKVEPDFKTIPTVDLNRTPQHRSDIAELARMFRYCLDPQPPKGKTWADVERTRRKRERNNLLRFLRASIATWARPDAVMDISTAPKRHQWHSNARVLALNPVGRRQTRKRRATLPIARQFAPHLDETRGFYIPVDSIRSAWDSMSAELGLPRERESGMKLIRRSVSHIARKRLGEEHWIQGKIFLGHHKDTVSDLYALMDPANLGRALAVTEAIIDEVEALAPGAFRRVASLRVVA
jgi:GrpB-like predicted nucleotidyltransferase (UPF0157 family)